MAYETKPEILKWEPRTLSFEDVLDTTCERLRERHIQYSIRRIREMEDELEALQKELDEFLSRRPVEP